MTSATPGGAIACTTGSPRRACGSSTSPRSRTSWRRSSQASRHLLRVVDVAVHAGQVGPAADGLSGRLEHHVPAELARRPATASSRLRTAYRATGSIPYAPSSSAASAPVSSRPSGSAAEHPVDHPLGGQRVHLQHRHRTRVAVAPVRVRGQRRERLDGVRRRVEARQARPARPARRRARGSWKSRNTPTSGLSPVAAPPPPARAMTSSVPSAKTLTAAQTTESQPGRPAPRGPPPRSPAGGDVGAQHAPAACRTAGRPPARCAPSAGPAWRSW